MTARRNEPPTEQPPERLSDELPTTEEVLTDELPTDVYDAAGARDQLVTPIRAISMKTPSEGSAVPVGSPSPVVARPALRARSEVATPVQPQNLGHLAPPYDAAQARARSVRDYLIWSCVAIILASAIALAMWFLAR